MYCTSQMQQIMVHELGPLTCVLLQIFVAFYSPVLLLCTSSTTKIANLAKKLFFKSERSHKSSDFCVRYACVWPRGSNSQPRSRAFLSYHSTLESLVTKWLIHCLCIRFTKYCNAYLTP